MTRAAVMRYGVRPGLLAGALGGAVAALWSLVDGAPLSSFILLIVLTGALLGALFGLLMWRQRPGAGETLFWGLAYGLLWWFLGPLTLLPLFTGLGLAWDVHQAQTAFPALMASLWYGAIAGLALAWMKSDQRPRTRDRTLVLHSSSLILHPSSLVRGALAGIAAAWAIGRLLAAQNELRPFAMMMSDAGGAADRVAWLVLLFIGALAGVAYALLYPRPAGGAGDSLIRGLVYGYFWWAAGALTLMPLLSGAGLAWTAGEALTAFATLPGFLLLGAALALFYQWLDALTRLLLADELGDRNQEGVGTEGLRALGRGVLAGLVGGLIFSLVMLRIGFFPTVASLVGSASPITGFIVHLVIAEIIGASYGLLFRRHSYDVGSALGWGLGYGFLWWILGPLTLLPVFLGGTPQWTIAAAAGTFPALIGHLAYGAGLGLVFYWMEARYRPWWLPRTQVEAARVARRKEQLLTSAPALWLLVVVIALTVPVVLGM